MCFWSRTESRAQGGSDDAFKSLLDLLIGRGNLTEREARRLAQQPARTLSLIDTHGVAHRSVYNTFPYTPPIHPPKHTHTYTDLRVEISMTPQCPAEDAGPSSRTSRSRLQCLLLGGFVRVRVPAVARVCALCPGPDMLLQVFLPGSWLGRARRTGSVRRSARRRVGPRRRAIHAQLWARAI